MKIFCTSKNGDEDDEDDEGCEVGEDEDDEDISYPVMTMIMMGIMSMLMPCS